MTEEDFRAALEARGFRPDPEDRRAALDTARFLERCARLLREAEAGGSRPGADDARG